MGKCKFADLTLVTENIFLFKADRILGALLLKRHQTVAGGETMKVVLRPRFSENAALEQLHLAVYCRYPYTTSRPLAGIQ